MGRHRTPAGSWRVRHIELAPPDPPKPAPNPDEQQLIANIAEVLASGAPVAAVALGVSNVLRLGAGITEAAIRALLELDGIGAVLANVPTPVRLPDSVRAQRRHELVRRGSYLLSAARRLARGVADGQLGSALETERRYLTQHRSAVAKRAVAAQRVADELDNPTVRVPLPNESPPEPRLVGMLGWYSVLDSKTSTECRAANRHNFNPAKIPVIGFPGAVHPDCRCRPGPPFPGKSFLEGSGPPRQVEVAASITDAVAGRMKAVREIELTKSSAYPGLERKPGKQNWVDKAGGLPDYIERIAKHLHYEKGMDISRAIATAVNTVKRWAAGGGDVSAATRAKAGKAVAEWEAKKAGSHAG